MHARVRTAGAGEGPVTVVTRSGGRGVSTLLYRYVPLGSFVPVGNAVAGVALG
jgi:hypothetical protein